MAEQIPAQRERQLLVHVCDDCGGQYAPEIFDEVCACLDREGARHLTEIEVVPCDDAAIERGAQQLVHLAGSMTQEQMIAAFMMGDRHVAAEILRSAGETP